MKRDVGLWIDHSKTVIVTVKDEVEVIREIRSNIEKHVQLPSRKRVKPPVKSNEPKTLVVAGQKTGNHLGGYFEGVISFIRDADSILIFGPGKAKMELKNHLDRANLGGRVVGIENVNKMTDQQIATKVRDHFLR